MNRPKSIVPACLAALLSLTARSAENPKDHDVPVAPVPPAACRGWTNAFCLKNKDLEVVVVPGIGRIVWIGWNAKENFLRSGEGLTGVLPAADGSGGWLNYGGDWLWPVAQSRWKDFQGSDWPPSRLLDGRPWSGTAWKCADGSLCCLITQDYGEPLHIKVSRLFRLDAEEPRLTIQQRVERVAESVIPVTLWNITQIGGAEAVVIPVDDAVGTGGVRAIMFEAPGEDVLSRCGDAVAFDARAGGERKLCSGSKRAWIAARKGDAVIMERITESSGEGDYPDGGCSLEMYSNSGLGYSEIETLSVERNLAAGETLGNTLVIQCRRLFSELKSPCDLAERVREWLGEVAQPPATPAE